MSRKKEARYIMKEKKAKEPVKEQNEEAKAAQAETAPEDQVQEEVVEEVVQEDPVADLQKQVEELTRQLAAAKTDVARAYADTDNTRKRLLRDADLVKKYRFQQAALELLPILDNMDMALGQVPESEETASFVKGFEMIRNQLQNAMTNEGVKEIDALNKAFDANTMQALMTEAVEGTEPGIVLQVLQKGYMLKDRLLRPALVKVSE